MIAAAVAERVGDGALLVALAIAFAAGVVSFLSPCVLPLVPAYLSFVTGLSAAELEGRALAESPDRRPPEEPPSRDPGGSTTRLAVAPPTAPTAPAAPAAAVRRRVVVGTLGFVLGAAVVFVSFGVLFGSLGEALRTHSVGVSQVFGGVTILLGLFLAGAFERLGFLQREVRIHRSGRRGLVAAPILGFTFALGWTPCIGPALGAVLGLSASTDGATAARGALLSVAYCLGLGVPLLVSGLAFTRAMRLFGVVKRHYRGLMVGAGASLVVLGLLQLTGVWARWTSEVQTRFGGWNLPL